MLVGAMYSAEYPLRSEDLKLLNPFVKQVREEIVESTEPGRRGITRTGYFMLNSRGRSLYRHWLGGGLDHLVAKQALAV